MWFSSWLGKRQLSAPSRRRHDPPRKLPTCRPQLEALEDRWLPSQVGLTVSSLADSGPGTLRAAILTADAGSHSDQFTIGFGVAGTIDLQSPLPDLNNSITIQSPGTSSLTIERGAGFSFSSAIVTVDVGQTASLSGLTITNGNAGGIFNDGGMLTVLNSAVVNNADVFNGHNTGVGGGIANAFGTLTVSGSIVSGNSATFGGGIYSTRQAALTISGSIVSGNSAPGFGLPSLHIFGEGGGIFNAGAMTVSACVISGNSAELGGGVWNSSFNGSTATISGTALSGNWATYGGGVYNVNGTLAVANASTLTGNWATYGGGIFADVYSSLTVRDSVFSANSAIQGGGIYNTALATLDVRGSALAKNTASDSGGGIYNLGTTTVQESSMSGNSASSDGGGIFNAASGTLAIKDSTVLHNVAASGADIYNQGALTLDDSTIGVIGP